MKIYAKSPNDKKGNKLPVIMVRQPKSQPESQCYIRTVIITVQTHNKYKYKFLMRLWF